MKRSVGYLITAAVFGSMGLASAATIANWRFEEGASTTNHNDSYLDTSGNENHLSAWANNMNPFDASDLPFASQGGVTNTSALEFSGWNSVSNNIGTWEWADSGQTNDVSAKMIDSYGFTNGWTIEATFKADSHQWGGILCKDGRPLENEGFPNFHMKVRDDDKTLDCGFFDTATNNYQLLTEPIVLGRWYSVAIVYDPATTNCSLYMKQQDGGDYVLQSSTNMTLEADLNLETGFWRVGNGMWEANPATDFFDGIIDEVKISDTALAPSEFVNQDGFSIPFNVEKPNAVVADGYIGWDIPFGLAASEYWSPAGWIFTGSTWEIATDTNFSSVVWSGTAGAEESITVPADALSDGNTYYARVRYLTDTDPSEWSDAYELQLLPVEAIAWWRFDELGNGERHNADNDGFYEDSSADGTSDLSSRLEKYRPVYTDNVGCKTTATNAASIKVGGFGGTYDNVAAGLSTDPSAVVNSYSFTNGWTIEASFMMHALRDWQVVLGKDGKPRDDRAESPFSFKVAPEGESFGLRCLVWHDDDWFDFLDTSDTIVVGKWYSVVATYNNASFKLYLKSEDDADYVLQGSLDRTQGFSLGQWNEPWSVGRGMWNGNKEAIFNGLIDEVRISNGALPTSHFLGQSGVNGAYDVRPPSKVYLSNFSGLDSVIRLSGTEAFSPRGYTLANSEWKVATDVGMTSVVWESGLVEGRNFVDIPPNSLPAATYYVGVRYQASSGVWSEWTAVAVTEVEALAHWRFEEGVDGAVMTNALDSTVNGNDLVWGTVSPPGWDAIVTPFATADVPYAVAPNSWDANNVALRIEDNQDYLITDGSALESYSFDSGWTVEATFRTVNPAGWQGIVSRSGKRSNGAEPQMRLFQRGDNQCLTCDGADSANTEWWRVDAYAVTQANQWYSMAVTYDNHLVRVYIKIPGSDQYELQASSNVPTGINLASVVREWRVGSALWDDQWNDALAGVIDEVRISAGALEPGGFIADEGAGWDSSSNGMADVWEIDNFGSVGVDPQADPDGDGLDNLTEYRLGGDPNDVNDMGYAVAYGTVDTGTGTNLFECTYPQRKYPYSGDVYSFETTDDLVNGTWVTTEHTVVPGAEISDEMGSITVQVPMDNDHKFIRKTVE